MKKTTLNFEAINDYASKHSLDENSKLTFYLTVRGTDSEGIQNKVFEEKATTKTEANRLFAKYQSFCQSWDNARKFYVGHVTIMFQWRIEEKFQSNLPFWVDGICSDNATISFKSSNGERQDSPKWLNNVLPQYKADI